jgi:PAS domain S-box-containing protein
MGNSVLPSYGRQVDAAALLQEYGLPEHAPVGQLRALARIAAAMCRVPTAVVNLLDGCFQHQVGEVGFVGARTASSTSMCALALSSPRLRHVPDASLEPSFADNPWVDGRLAAVRFYASAPLVLPGGHVLGSLCVFSDRPGSLDDAQRAALEDLAGQAVFLVEQARGAREAARQAALFRLVAEGSVDVLSRHRPDGTVLYASPSVGDVLGLDATALVGTSAGQHVHPEDRSVLDQAFEAVRSGRQESVTAILRYGHADGSRRCLEVQLAPIRDERGHVVELHSAARDVTGRIEAQAALAAARDDAERRAALTSAVLETIDVGVVACDAHGRLTLLNRAARDLHGMAEDPTPSPDDWAGRYSLYAEDGTTLLLRDEVPLFRALTDGALQDASMVIAPSDAPARTVRCDGRAMRDGDGHLLGAVVAMKDVTDARARAEELTQARDQALAATRAKTAFLAAASHEIRTPLHGVLGTLELLSLQNLTSEQSEYVRVAHESGRSLLRLLNDVLDLSKAEATTVVLADEPLRPLTVVRDVVSALEPVAARKGLELRLDAGRDEVVRGDASRLRQVLMNLVGNAVKFTSDGSVTVAVDTGPLPGGRAALRLSVTDTGPGMRRDEVGRLSQPFVQGSQGQCYGGTGLGLALTQQILDLMGGHVEVTSEPGRGSTFTVAVDLAPAARTSRTVPP